MQYKSLVLHLLIFQCEADTQDRMERLERKKTDSGKRKRVQHKINRTEEQALRFCFGQINFDL